VRSMLMSRCEKAANGEALVSSVGMTGHIQQSTECSRAKFEEPPERVGDNLILLIEWLH
jgi:hypothetical protein